MRAQAIYAKVERQSNNAGVAETVHRHAESVRRIAHHLAARLPSSVDTNDLVQAGMIGLLEAARNYDTDQGAAFETYASIRIRGAMIDEIRRNDWMPRSVHRRMRAAAAATRSIEQRHGRAAQAGEIAAELGVGIDEYHQLLEDAARGQIFDLDAQSEGDDENQIADNSDSGDSPLRSLEQGEFQSSLAVAIGALPEREKLVLSLYYEQEQNLREIGAVLGITESRVCQILGQSMLRLRARLQDWRERA